MGAADPIFKTPTKAPAAPVASPAPLAPYDPDPYYGTNTKTPTAIPAPVAMPAPAVAPTAPQQPYVNPFMQTYGQNNTPQQQMFNRFPQRFQQPQPVAQPAQGPVYADQSLNAPGNQPQQFQQPQYGRFGRGFMPQNRGGYERQMDNLRGGYNRPMPPMMPQQDGGYGGGYGQQATRYISPEERNSMEAYYRQDGINQANRLRVSDTPEQQAYANQMIASKYFEQSPDINILATRGAKYPTAGQTPIPDYARPYVQQLQGGQQPIAGQPSAPAGGKGGSPVASAQLNPFQAALVKGGTPYVQGAPGAPYAIGQGIPGGAPGGYMPLMNSNGTPVSSLASANPAGGKGGNPTSNY